MTGYDVNREQASRIEPTSDTAPAVLLTFRGKNGRKVERWIDIYEVKFYDYAIGELARLSAWGEIE